MKRLHLHTKVRALEPSIVFYSALFGAPPAVRKDDYAKWLLDEPRINFAISARGGEAGVDHLGFQFETGQELEAFAASLEQAGVAGRPQKDAACCYAKSDKVWLADPDGLTWETFATHGEHETYGEDDIDLDELRQVCCATETAKTPCC
jgi:catechol 2,3-dioxygenase-like lactoylglutathione lyase family enzyme